MLLLCGIDSVANDGKFYFYFIFGNCVVIHCNDTLGSSSMLCCLLNISASSFSCYLVSALMGASIELVVFVCSIFVRLCATARISCSFDSYDILKLCGIQFTVCIMCVASVDGLQMQWNM